jgi:DNA ligase-1
VSGSIEIRCYTIAAMRRLAETAAAVAATPRTSEKTRLLAGYLASLPPDDLPIACVFVTGRPFPSTDSRIVGVGWSAVSEAVERAAGAEPGAFGAAYNRSSDPGMAAAELLAAGRAGGGTPDGPAPTLQEVADAFAGIVAARRPAARTDLLTSLLGRCDPLTGMYVVKVLSGELRIGLRDGLLEAAIARAFERPAAAVSRAAMLTGDLGQTAVLARQDRLGEAHPLFFRPLRPMLASPTRDADEIVARLGVPIWTEDKYDGIRAQLHKLGSDVRIYSRDLHDVSGQFPEVADAARALDWDGILDGELLAMREGRILAFAQLQNRLGRKAPGASVLASVPAGYVAFDVLVLASAGREPESLLETPLRDRRRRLEGLALPPDRFALATLCRVESAADLDAGFDAARSRGNEGLVAKDPGSPYTPGRRGMAWLKLKKALATLDCVVVGVEVGHGKRHGVLSDYTFAVRDDRPGKEGGLVTVGKAYSGLTDVELDEMTHWFQEHTIRELGRYRVVQPTVVVEVAFDRVQPSGRHASGFAMRFPRIARLRPDKTPAEADTLSAVAALVDPAIDAGDSPET